eukprot:1828164-Prymnesium_polylepis.1
MAAAGVAWDGSTRGGVSTASRTRCKARATASRAPDASAWGPGGAPAQRAPPRDARMPGRRQRRRRAPASRRRAATAT